MFEAAEYIGLVAFAMSGFFIAVRNKLDFLGVLVSVFLTSAGGGILRDVTVDIKPYTFTHSSPALVIFSVMILMVIFRFHKKESLENQPLFILSDSIGLVSFSITGTLIAMEHDLNFAGVLALAFATAIGGGIMRDVIINEVPFVLKTGFYGTIALLIAAMLFFLDSLGLLGAYSLTAVFIFSVILRLIAYYKHWSIPML